MSENWVIAGCAITALGLMAGHWFPWPVKMHKTFNYAYGTAFIMIGQAIALCGSGLANLLPWLFAVDVAGGLSVWLAYVVDSRLNKFQRLLIEWFSNEQPQQ